MFPLFPSRTILLSPSLCISRSRRRHRRRRSEGRRRPRRRHRRRRICPSLSISPSLCFSAKERRTGLPGCVSPSLHLSASPRRSEGRRRRRRTTTAGSFFAKDGARAPAPWLRRLRPQPCPAAVPSRRAQPCPPNEDHVPSAQPTVLQVIVCWVLKFEVVLDVLDGVLHFFFWVCSLGLLFIFWI